MPYCMIVLIPGINLLNLSLESKMSFFRNMETLWGMDTLSEEVTLSSMFYLPSNKLEVNKLFPMDANSIVLE